MPAPASDSPGSWSARRNAPRRAAAAMPLSSCPTSERKIRNHGIFRGPGAGARAARSGQQLVVTVDVRREDDDLRLTAQKVEPIDGVVAHAAAGLRVFVAEAEALPRLKSLISREAGRARQGDGGTRPAEPRGRIGAAGRLSHQPRHSRRGQIAAGDPGRTRHLSGARIGMGAYGACPGHENVPLAFHPGISLPAATGSQSPLTRSGSAATLRPEIF